MLRNCARCGSNFGAAGREYLCSACREPRIQVPLRSAQLSTRERQIVRLIQQAKANKEIAFELCLTVGTVKEYMYRIFRKVGVQNRTALALWASENLSAEF